MRSTLWPAIIFLLLLLMLAVSLWRNQQPATANMLEQPMPAFTAPLLFSAGELSSEQLRGKPYMLNIFASWCLPCVAEHPQLLQLAKKAPLYALAYKDKPENTKAFLQRRGNPFIALAQDSNGRIAIDLGATGVPETFLIDASGVIRYRHQGPIMPQDMETIEQIWQKLSAP